MNNKLIMGLFTAFAIVVLISSLQNTAFVMQSQQATSPVATPMPEVQTVLPSVTPTPTITVVPTLPPTHTPIQRPGGFRIQGGGEDD